MNKKYIEAEIAAIRALIIACGDANRRRRLNQKLQSLEAQLRRLDK